MPSRLLIVRLGSLGDLIHTLPAVSAIRRAHPDAEIDWLIDAPHRELLDLVPILTSIITLDHPTPAGWLDARRRLRAREYFAALDFQGLVKSAALTWLSGARRRIGFERSALREPAAAAFYSERARIWRRKKCSLPPDQHTKRSIPSAISAIISRGRWGLPLRMPPLNEVRM